MACDKVAVKDGVWQSCVWQRWCAKLVRDKVVCQSCVWQLVCVKGKVSVWQSCVSKLRLTVGVCQRWWSKMVCDKVVCDKDGVRQSVCERWCWQSVCESLCVSMVCDKVCVTKCVRKMVCDKDGVCEEAGGGRRREGGAPGIQNQKQEPHTKLWGKNTFETSQTHSNNTRNIKQTPWTSLNQIQKTCDKRQVKTNKHIQEKKTTKTKSCKKNTNFQTNSKYATELEKPFEKNNTFLFQILEF